MGNNTKVSSSKWAVHGIHKENFPFYTELPEPEKLGESMKRLEVNPGEPRRKFLLR
jgi:hypothetical protein